MHMYASFYETHEPEEARKLVERFKFHFTPKHGSWLNMAKIELSVLAQQCLDRRTPDKDMLTREVLARRKKRNDEVVKVLWQFTTSHTRIKLKSLYPKIEV